MFVQVVSLVFGKLLRGASGQSEVSKCYSYELFLTDKCILSCLEGGFSKRL